MRKSPIIDVLFPTVRGRVLATAFGQPQREWFVTELSQFLHTRPSSLQREIDALGKAGILAVRRIGRRVYVKANEESPVFDEMRGLFEKTTGMFAVLQRELQSLSSGIRFGFVYGSTARSTEDMESDIDLMLIGTLQMSDLVLPLRRAEKILGRPVNATVYTEAEFAEKAGSHFLKTVLAGPLKFLKGDEDELGRLVGQKSSAKPSDK